MNLKLVKQLSLKADLGTMINDQAGYLSQIGGFETRIKGMKKMRLKYFRNQMDSVRNLTESKKEIQSSIWKIMRNYESLLKVGVPTI